jgi:predicted metal-dependent hydrolase
VDGIFVDPETGNKILMEVKTRQKKLFDVIPKYEKTQVKSEICENLYLDSIIHVFIWDYSMRDGSTVWGSIEKAKSTL